jgi:hypothetical protein
MAAIQASPTAARGTKMYATLTQDQIDLLQRNYAYVKANPGQSPDWNDDLYNDGENRRQALHEAYEDFTALGFLNPNLSGLTSGSPFGVLSSEGRWFLQSLETTPTSQEDPPSQPIGFRAPS